MSNDSQHWEDEQSRITGEVPQVFSGLSPKKSGPPRWVGLLLMVASLGFTIGTVTLLLTRGGDAPAPEQPAIVADVADISTEQTEQNNDSIAETDDASTGDDETEDEAIVLMPTDAPTQAPIDEQSAPSIAGVLPTLDPEAAAALLAQPIIAAQNIGQGIDLPLDPFTIIPDRPRSEMIRYTVAENDTINSIAERFSLSTDSIAWSNSREIIQRFLRPGDVLNIPPEDGVYFQATGSLRSFREYAELYGVDDPFIILDSPYNPTLRDFAPDDIPSDGTYIFVPGGVSFDVVWPAAIEIIEDVPGQTGGSTGGAQGQDAVFRVSFQNGQAGSCAAQVAEGASFWSNPLAGANYRFIRGFAGYHPGLDLAAPVGTAIRAANGGRVVFSGWNDFGYGYMVAIVHGPTLTVYAHMVGQPSVGCGQFVASGEVIGQVGSTGNSSGPHLHFEVRSRQGNNYVPVDPYSVIGF